MDEAPLGAPQPPHRGLAELGEVRHGAVSEPVPDASLGQAEPLGERSEQRRLAGTGLADDGEHLARPQVEVDVAAAVAVAVPVARATHLKQGLRVVHAVTSSMLATHVLTPTDSASVRAAAARSQWSVSEQTNIDAPLSSVMTSSR